MAKDLSQERFMLLELLAWWQGSVTNSQLVKALDISRQQAYSDIKKYCKLHPHNLIHAKQGYIPSTTFKAHYISGDVSQFLSWWSTGSILNTKLTSSHVVQLAIPTRKVSVKVIRALVKAIIQQKSVEAAYVSLSHPENDGRIFHPHTFVNTGLRWHVRGYCEKAQDYRDLVLSRFHDDIELLEDSSHPIELDEAWLQTIKIILKPDQRLSIQQQSVLANDYQLNDGLLIIETRAALANYILHEMKVNTKMLDGTPEAQQWIVVNIADIKQWMF
ncbi:WYL domain-containing protein [Shewanella frigidimarina]|uniref:WYL domain-containing protein n=1 Tax=Shewanella frigidimarina TaxID=56812 RepID=UPI003D7BE3D9